MVYLLCILVPIMSLVSLYSDNIWVVCSPAVCAFIIVPILDFIPFKFHLAKGSQKTFNNVLYAVCFFYLFAIVLFLNKLPELNGTMLVLKSFMMALSGVVVGINCAHELGHRNSRGEILLAKTLLFTVSYMQFFIEHNRGHHKNVSTLEDPATSRYNETLYSFWIRSMFMGWISAFKIEKKSNGLLKNRMIHYSLYSLSFLMALGLTNTNMMLGFAIHSFVSVILLETVNYIEHYGLLRKKVNGRYEKVAPIHSWNSDCFFSRVFLFELPRHSEHHAIAYKPYFELESVETAPQMPTGYAGMIVLAAFSPAWFRLMNPRVNQYYSHINNTQKMVPFTMAKSTYSDLEVVA